MCSCHLEGYLHPLWHLLCPLRYLPASSAQPHAHSARPLRLQHIFLRPQRGLMRTLRCPCALSAVFCVLSAPPSGPMCPQRTPLRPQCTTMSNPYHTVSRRSTPPSPLTALWIIHRPVDYSTLPWIIYLQCIVFPPVFSAVSSCRIITVPQHYSVNCKVTLQCLLGHSIT